MPLQASTAPVSKDTVSGSGIRFPAGTRTTSAKPAVEREAELPDGIGAERVTTGPAGGAAPAADEVVDGNPIAFTDSAPCRGLEHDAGALVPEHEAVVRRRDHPFEEVELRSAHPAGAGRDERPSVSGRIRDVLDAHLATLDQHGCFHRSSLTSGHCSQR